jgi:metal-responsive CopG/Arc/MetJ family transcriptional regulator
VTDEMTAEYRRSRGWSPDPGETSRISCVLPRELVRRLNRQARLVGAQRQQLIEAAVEGLLRDLEAIDAEEGTHQ